jgi:predicted nuclease of predicted toxin-antitoxin system
MKFLADMGISQALVTWLRENGFDAIHVRELGMHRASDAEILLKAKEKGCIVLTCDIGFGDIMAAIKEECPSVVIFRLKDETPSNVIRRLQQVLKESRDALLKGAIISVEETRHRVRLLPL